MLDNLTLTSARPIIPEDAAMQLQGLFTNYRTTESKYHQRVTVFFEKPKERLLSLHSGPKYAGVAPIKLELNPARLRSSKRLFEVLARLVNPSECRISRVDHACDIEVPIEKVWGSLLFSRKKRREIYGNGADLSGGYLGTYPERLVVYDCAQKRNIPGPVTRLEMRQWGQKVPIQDLERLPEYQSYRPFERLEFLRPKSPKDQTTEIKKAKAGLLGELISEKGLQPVSKYLNRHAHFRRDFGHLLERADQIPDLDGIYQSNLATFFGRGE